MGPNTFTLRWGILATGGIAKTFCKDLLVDPSTRDANDIAHKIVAAASSTSQARAQEFLDGLGVSSAKGYGSYEELARDPDIDIIYVATPHSHHYQNTRLCLEAGKHVLIEKPVTVNAKQAETLIDMAKEKNLFFMEAVWTRFFPLAKEVKEFVKSGKLGEVKRVWADLSFWNEFGNEHRMVNMDLAGGVLLDLGVYSLTWLFIPLYDSSDAKNIHVASKITKYGPTGCDEQTSVILSFPSGAHGIATTSISVASPIAKPTSSTSSTTDNIEPQVRIQGTYGDLTISGYCFRPTSYTMIPASSSSRGKLADWEYKEVKHDIPAGHGMFWEADECARCIRDGKIESEEMSWNETVEIMRVMDEVRQQGTLVYPEKIESTQYPLKL